MNSSDIGCVKAATKILGDKWTPQLLRYFLNEEFVRFSQAQDFVEGINPRTLSARLDSLESEGIIEKVYPNDKSRCEYKLTQKGSELAPIIRDMEAWSHRYASTAS